MLSFTRSRGNHALRNLVVICAGTALTSCTASQPQTSAPPTPTAVRTTERLGSHWVQDERLRTVMASLSKQSPNWPAGIPQEPEAKGFATAEQFDEVAALAGDLARTADLLPMVAAGIKMTEADRRGFLAEAQTLMDQAQRLQSAAQLRRIEPMQREMDAINSTCISCHSRYRDFSGLINSPRADFGTASQLTASVR